MIPQPRIPVFLGNGNDDAVNQFRCVQHVDDVLDDPGRSSQMSNGSLLVGGALGGDWFLPFGSARGGMVLGFRAGYNYAPIETDWTIDGNDVAGGPDVALTGAFVRLSIGGGSR